MATPPVTIKHFPPLHDVPEPVRRELQWLRGYSYHLLDRINAIPAPSATKVTTKGGSNSSVAIMSPGIQMAMSAQRPKTAETGTVFFSTDHSVAWYWSTKSMWTYAWGKDRGLLGLIGNAGGVALGPADAGLLYYATDYDHAYEWNGTAWHFTGGDSSQFIVTTVGGPPSGGLWGLCDGSTYTCAVDDGSTGAVISTVVANGYLRR